MRQFLKAVQFRNLSQRKFGLVQFMFPPPLFSTRPWKFRNVQLPACCCFGGVTLIVITFLPFFLFLFLLVTQGVVLLYFSCKWFYITQNMVQDLLLATEEQESKSNTVLLKVFWGKPLTVYIFSCHSEILAFRSCFQFDDGLIYFTWLLV